MDQTVDDDEPEDPIFFLSYAHGPRMDLVERFFETLSEHVQQLFGLSADVVGFMAELSLKGGERWSDSLMTALGTCRVFVPLISLSYVNSEWCAREWHAFHRRAVHTAKPGGNTTPVLPVLWSALPEAETPRAIRNLQFFRPGPREPADLRARYRRDALYGFGVLERDPFDSLVWRVAQEIQRVDAEHRVEPVSSQTLSGCRPRCGMTMSASPDGYYFFLSYAHSAPLGPAAEPETDDIDPIETDADPLVEGFYRDLRLAVSERVPPGRTNIGFLDQDLPPGADIKAGLAAALGSAQVFVPLYSPRYFTRSWPLREEAAFRRRLRMADVNPESRIVPVLWTPVLPSEQRPDVQRAMNAAGAVSWYRENGLRALFLLKSRRSAYEGFRTWLADEIVAVAEHTPLEPSTTLSLEEVEGLTLKEARFLVAMLDPGEVPTRTHPWWHGYAAPVAEHAATLADRLGLQSEVTDVAEAERLFERTPGIVLVDPWPTGNRAESMASRLRALPPWVLPVVLEEPQEKLGEHGAAVQATINRLKNAVTGRLESASNMAQLERLLPGLVARARGRYLKQIRIDGISGSGRRPRLRDVT